MGHPRRRGQSRARRGLLRVGRGGGRQVRGLGQNGHLALMIRALLPAIGLVLLPALCSAQNDGGWWRQLFKPKQESPSTPSSVDAGQDMPAEGDADAAPSEGGADRVEYGASAPMEVDSAVEVQLGIAGSVAWDVSTEILRLDSGRPARRTFAFPVTASRF